MGSFSILASSEGGAVTFFFFADEDDENEFWDAIFWKEKFNYSLDPTVCFGFVYANFGFLYRRQLLLQGLKIPDLHR